VRPTVGFIPARLLLLVGETILPSVSVPRLTAVSPIEVATPDPDDEPDGSPLGKYAHVV
jgi:hypothetical protein